MKYAPFAFLIAFLASSAFAQSTTYICSSPDFDPSNFDGQSLKVKMDEQGAVTSIEKMEGSWYCDDGKNLKPALLSSSAKNEVYDAQMNCDEAWGRLVVPAKFKPAKDKMKYSFSDAESGVSTYSLSCKEE